MSSNENVTVTFENHSCSGVSRTCGRPYFSLDISGNAKVTLTVPAKHLEDIKKYLKKSAPAVVVIEHAVVERSGEGQNVVQAIEASTTPVVPAVAAPVMDEATTVTETAGSDPATSVVQAEPNVDVAAPAVPAPTPAAPAAQEAAPVVPAVAAPVKPAKGSKGSKKAGSKKTDNAKSVRRK